MRECTTTEKVQKQNNTNDTIEHQNAKTIHYTTVLAEYITEYKIII